MSENTKREVKSGQVTLDQGIGDEDQFKSEENAIHVLEAHEIDQEIIQEDNENTYHLSSGEYNKANISADHEQHNGLVLGDDVKDPVARDQEQDDCQASGDDDNETVAEVHDSVHPSYSTDMEDIAFSIKNIIPCMGRKAKSKTKNHHREKETLMPIDVHFEGSRGFGQLVNNKDIANSCIDPDQYVFSHPHRGHAVLIVNKDFRSYEARAGADVDIQKTLMVLQKLGFSIINKEFRNLDKQSTLRVLRHAKDKDHSMMDSFAFIISSHGKEFVHPRNRRQEHAIFCSDDQYIFTNDILEMFSDENCPSLKGKPKMFFIQACRGSNIDPGAEIMVGGRYQESSDISKSSYADGKKPNTVPHNPDTYAFHSRDQGADEMDTKGAEDSSHEKPIVHCNNDCLIMYAIPSGYFAWRNNTDGSWMLHYLWKELMNYNLKKPCSFLKVLTATSRRMANRETVKKNTTLSGKKAIPVIIHRLYKDIVFQD